MQRTRPTWRGPQNLFYMCIALKSTWRCPNLSDIHRTKPPHGWVSQNLFDMHRNLSRHGGPKFGLDIHRTALHMVRPQKSIQYTSHQADLRGLKIYSIY
ncbi:hypothetical protein AVEN_200518-1 [Araneus ventricosus]|uniref:Uncharacterized protein n=1 Tax=Araneus ventricosus TaxID=182803 RepID=A0A4Y2MN43_ARAVE|nr:hypothetical protein AVEN_200518-1 [Araneus ventricosus]